MKRHFVLRKSSDGSAFFGLLYRPSDPWNWHYRVIFQWRPWYLGPLFVPVLILGSEYVVAGVIAIATFLFLAGWL